MQKVEPSTEGRRRERARTYAYTHTHTHAHTDTYRRSSYAAVCAAMRALLGIPKPLCATGGAGKGLVAARPLDLCCGEEGVCRMCDVCSGVRKRNLCPDKPQ